MIDLEKRLVALLDKCKYNRELMIYLTDEGWFIELDNTCNHVMLGESFGRVVTEVFNSIEECIKEAEEVA